MTLGEKNILDFSLLIFRPVSLQNHLELRPEPQCYSHQFWQIVRDHWQKKNMREARSTTRCFDLLPTPLLTLQVDKGTQEFHAKNKDVWGNRIPLPQTTRKEDLPNLTPIKKQRCQSSKNAAKD